MEVAMAVDGIRQRFDALVADAESIGGRVKSILAKAAEEINSLFGTDSHPAQGSIIQRLEQAAHLATTSPALQVKAPEQAADPTPAGQQQPAAGQDDAESTTGGEMTTSQPAGQTLPEQSTPSEGTSNA
jgi:hypothetical protein